MTSDTLLKWCYQNQNSGQPGTVTIEFEKLNVDPELIKARVATLCKEGYLVDQLNTSTFCFVELTDKGLDYCRTNFD